MWRTQLRLLGAEVLLCGVVGNDDAKSIVFNLLHKAAIASHGIFFSDTKKTVIKQRIVVNGHHMLRLDSDDTPYFSEEDCRRLRPWSSR